MEIQQSTYYANYLRKLGWITPKLNSSYIYIKHFPLIGGFAKIQRITNLPNIHTLISILRKAHVKQIVVEPDSSISQSSFTFWMSKASKYISIHKSSYLATKTHIVNLMLSEEMIFNGFSEAKRRGVRRAIKNKVHIQESENLSAFIRLKNKTAGFLGFITTSGIQPLWDTFRPNNATVLIDTLNTSGILLLFWDTTAYYWLAGATGEGKKLFAPTLLVWEAMLLAKKKGCTRFDFVGVWDERLPFQNKAWSGFTKFKEGFGGEPLYYPIYR